MDPGLTPTQQRILELLPASAQELAMALYNDATRAELLCIYAHISYLRRRLDGRRIATRRLSKRTGRRVEYFCVPAAHREEEPCEHES